MDNPTEYFIDFLNGELEASKEYELLSRMALDEDLRGDFKCFARISNSMKKNLAELLPGASLSSSIFNSLGYSYPGGGAGSANQFLSFLSSRQFLTGLISSVSSIALTVAALMLFVFPKLSPAPQNAVAAANNKVEAIKGVSPEKSKQEFAKPDIDNNKVITKIKYVYIPAKAQSEPVGRAATANSEFMADFEGNQPVNEKKFSMENPPESPLITPSNIEPARKMPASDELAGDGNLFAAYELSESTSSVEVLPTENNNEKNKVNLAPNQSQSSRNINLANLSPALQSERNIGITIELRSSAYWNLPQETIYPNELSKFNNLGFSLLYNPYKNFSVGADIRQETFFAEYSGTELYEKKYKYEQQPNFTSYGLVLRYHVGFWDDRISPMAQIYLGFNDAGYVSRPMLGFCFRIENSISAHIAVEYSRMWYFHQNSWFDASKYGILYGISYNF